MERGQDGLVLREVLGKVALCLHFYLYLYDGNDGGIGKSSAQGILGGTTLETTEI